MATPSKTITYDNLESFTRESYDKKLIQEVEYDSAITRFFMSRRVIRDWGQRMNIPFRYLRADGTTTANFGASGLQPITYYDVETSTQAYVTPKWTHGAIYITKQEQDMNKGEAAMISMLDEKYEYLRDDMAFAFRNATNGAWSDGSAANGWFGIQYWVPDDPTTGTMANVDRSDTTYQYWARSILDSTTTLATLNWKSLEVLQNDITVDGTMERMPDFIVTTQTIFENLWAQAHDLQKNTLKKGLVADLGLHHINFNGTPIVFDVDCPADHLFMLRSKDWELRLYPNSNNMVTPWKDDDDNEAKIKKMIIGGQIVCKCPSRQGVMTALA